MCLHQKKYDADIIHRAKMDNCKHVATPTDSKSKLSADDGDPVLDPTLYRSLAADLEYLTFIISNIAYAVQQCYLFMHSPQEPHFNTLKRIIRYVKETIDFGLHLYPYAPTKLITYTDADGGDVPTHDIPLLGNGLSW